VVCVLLQIGLAILSFSHLDSRPVKSFGKATILKESPFKLPELLVQKVIRLVDQAEQSVRGDLGSSLLNIGPIGRIGPVLFISKTAHHLFRLSKSRCLFTFTTRARIINVLANGGDRLRQEP
jgi:hypothetical protein